MIYPNIPTGMVVEGRMPICPNCGEQRLAKGIGFWWCSNCGYLEDSLSGCAA